MHLSMHADYALRTLMYLGCTRGQTVSISEISEAYGISRHHLNKVVAALSQHGYVTTQRGKSGGIRLDRAPAKIRLGDVVRDMEPHLHLVECFDRERDGCVISPACGLQFFLRDALQRFFDALNQYTLADTITAPRKMMTLLQARVGAADQDR